MVCAVLTRPNLDSLILQLIYFTLFIGTFDRIKQRLIFRRLFACWFTEQTYWQT